MPLKLNQAYLRAKRLLTPEALSRLDSIIDADPKMARYLNEYGMENTANSQFPVTVMPPQSFLQLARRYEDHVSDGENVDSLINRIQSDQPQAHRMDFYDDEGTPEFLRGYMKHNPRASSSDIYYQKGVGLPKGYDLHPDVSVHGDPDEWNIETGGMPLLKWTPRGQRAISITDHEGRGRNAFAASEGFSLPIQMMERAAILPGDPYVPTYRTDEILNRLGRGTPERNAKLNYSLNAHRESIPLNETGEPLDLDTARGFLRQIMRAVPEDYVRHGLNRRGEKNGPPLAIPWKHPVFAEGGAVRKDDTGVLSAISAALRIPQPFNSPIGAMIQGALPRIAEGVASEYYGVNQNDEVNFGGYTKGAPMRDRFRPNVAIEPLGLPGLFGHEPSIEALNDSSRTDTAVRDAFGLGDEEGFLDSAAYLGGKALAVPILSGGRGMQTITQGLLKNAPKYLRNPVRALETVTDVFNPASGRVRDTPVAGVMGAGIQKGLESGMEAAADPLALLEMDIDDAFGGPEEFLAALEQGDPRAQEFADRYAREKKIAQNKADYAEYLYDAR